MNYLVDLGRDLPTKGIIKLYSTALQAQVTQGVP